MEKGCQMNFALRGIKNIRVGNVVSLVKKVWKRWNQGSIVYGQWVQVKTLTGATRETLDDVHGVTLRFCV